MCDKVEYLSQMLADNAVELHHFSAPECTTIAAYPCWGSDGAPRLRHVSGLRPGLLREVLDGPREAVWVIGEHAQACVAVGAEQTADQACSVAVVDVQAALSVAHVATAQSTVAALLREHCLVVLLGQAEPPVEVDASRTLGQRPVDLAPLAMCRELAVSTVRPGVTVLAEAELRAVLDRVASRAPLRGRQPAGLQAGADLCLLLLGHLLTYARHTTDHPTLSATGRDDPPHWHIGHSGLTDDERALAAACKAAHPFTPPVARRMHRPRPRKAA